MICAALAVSLPVGGVAHAQTEAVAQKAEPAIVGTLIANANFWRSKKNFAFAQRELNRALLLSPSNADVLADSAEMALDTGDAKAADSYLQRLSLVAPNGARTKSLAAEHALTPEEAAMLAEARRLGQAGDNQGPWRNTPRC